MIVLVLFQLFLIFVFLWLITNVIRYAFFRTSGRMGGFFSLSDNWLSLQNQPENSQIPDIVDKVSKKTQSTTVNVVDANFRTMLDKHWVAWAKQKGILR